MGPKLALNDQPHVGHTRDKFKTVVDELAALDLFMCLAAQQGTSYIIIVSL